MEQEHLEQNNQRREEGVHAPEDTDSLTAKVRDERGTKDHILVMVIALIVVALALAYLWGSGVGKRAAVDDVPDVLPPMLPQEEVLEDEGDTQGDRGMTQTNVSDDSTSIESDLLTVDIENLDAELETLEAELQSALLE